MKPTQALSQTLRFGAMAALTGLLGACDPATATTSPASGAVEAPVDLALAGGLAPLQSGQPSLADELPGRIVVVDFFATWCEPCRESIDPLNALRARYPADQLLIVAVSLDEDSDVVLPYATEAGISYPVYLDPERNFAESLGVTSLPAALILTSDTNVKFRATKIDSGFVALVDQELQ